MSNIDPVLPSAHIMQRLDEMKRLTNEGVEYWMARELGPVLGYPVWQNFEAVVLRAADALTSSGEDPSHQIMPTHKMMGRGRGAQAEGRDYFLSRGASYLIAMNGDPAKPEIAAAQLYFAARTRQMELEEGRSEDLKRLELRQKVTQSHKRVSSAAKGAGVRSHMQGVFHDARFRGLYEKSTAALKRSKGLKDKDNLFDRAGPLELSANDFQMNLAADVIERDQVRGEQKAIDTNLAVARRVRKAISDSGATLPEHLPLAEPISEVRKRLSGKAKRIAKEKDTDT